MLPQLFRAKDDSRAWIVIVIAASIMWAILVLWPHLVDPFRVPVDVQNHYWMAKFQDPALFPNDPLVYDQILREIKLGGYPMLIYPRSLGYGLLFYVGSLFISPIWLSKLLIFLLLPVTIVYLYKFGLNLGSRKRGLALGMTFFLFNLASPDSLSLASGLQRSFTLPFLIIFLFYVSTQNHWGASILIVLAALFYLPNAPIMILTYFIALFREQDAAQGRPIWRRKGFVIFLSAAIVSMILATWAVLSSNPPSNVSQLSNLLNDVPILADPRHQPGGAAPFYLHIPWIGRAGIFESYPEAVILLVMLILCGIFLSIIPKKRLKGIPRSVWYLLGGGLFMYFISMISLFVFSMKILYMPSRNIRGALFLIPVFFLSANANGITSGTVRWIQEYDFKEKLIFTFVLITGTSLITGIVFGFSWPDWLGWSLMILGGVLLSGGLVWCLFALLRKIFRQEGEKDKVEDGILFGLFGFSILIGFFFYSRVVGFGTINPTRHERALYDFVGTLPKDTLLAGSPEELTAVPLFSKRDVLFHDLRPKKSAPILGTYRAYYAEKSGQILDFCDQHGVDYLVYNNDDFDQEYISRGDFFFQPYNQEIMEIVSGKKEFVLPKAEVVFRSGPLGVVKCSPSSFDSIEMGNVVNEEKGK